MLNGYILTISSDKYNEFIETLKELNIPKRDNYFSHTLFSDITTVYIDLLDTDLKKIKKLDIVSSIEKEAILEQM